MADASVIQRHAHLAGAVKLEFVDGPEGKIAKAVLTAISNTRRRSGETRSQHAQDGRRAAEMFAADIEVARDEERRTVAMQSESLNGTQHDLNRARSDAAAASSAGDRLRAQYAALAASCRAALPASPAAARSSPAAPAAGDLLAEVQRRIDQAAGGIAAHADAARAAGLGCEQDYDAVSAAQSGA